MQIQRERKGQKKAVLPPRPFTTLGSNPGTPSILNTSTCESWAGLSFILEVSIPSTTQWLQRNMPKVAFHYVFGFKGAWDLF